MGARCAPTSLAATMAAAVFRESQWSTSGRLLRGGGAALPAVPRTPGLAVAAWVFTWVLTAAPALACPQPAGSRLGTRSGGRVAPGVWMHVRVDVDVSTMT